MFFIKHIEVWCLKEKSTNLPIRALKLIVYFNFCILILQLPID